MILAHMLVQLAWIGAGAAVTIGLITFALNAYQGTFSE